MTLTPDQKEMVRSTWALVVPMQEEAARLFYGKLFEIDPSTGSLFAGTDMSEQGKKLMQTINVAVAGLERLDLIKPPSRIWDGVTSAMGSKTSNTRAWGRRSCGLWGRAWGKGLRPRSRKRGQRPTARWRPL